MKDLKTYPEEKLRKIVDCLEEEQYEDGQCIIRQGTVGDHFFIIRSGKCSVRKDTTDGNQVSQLTKVLKIKYNFRKKSLYSSQATISVSVHWSRYVIIVKLVKFYKWFVRKKGVMQTSMRLVRLVATRWTEWPLSTWSAKCLIMTIPSGMGNELGHIFSSNTLFLNSWKRTSNPKLVSIRKPFDSRPKRMKRWLSATSTTWKSFNHLVPEALA